MAAKVTNKTELIKSINPATLEVNAEIEATPAGKIAEIAEAARGAQKKWAAFTFDKRADYLLRVRDNILANLDDIARTITIDNGKTLLESLNAEIYPTLDMIRFCVKEAGKILREEKLDNPIFPIARIESGNTFEPLGVVGIISPWNYPFAIPMTQILPAIAAGNTVVLKPSNLTALVGERIRRIFEESGLPEGVVNVVQGAGAALGDAIMRAGLNRIVFTGSVAVGKRLMAQAAETLTPITLELGGKDPFIVLDDADIDRASSAAVWGAFLNAGQTCASVERVYVHESIADKFTAMVVAKTNKLRIGNGLDSGTDMGPMISEERILTVEAHVADAVKKGARVLTGGGRAENLRGYFYKPTVLADTNHTMDGIMEETFGPTLPIMTFSDIEEVIALANDSKYGLTASVWSKDLAKAKSVARRIQTGTVVINNCLFTYGFAQLPWGGVKNSGIGRTHSAHGLLDFTNIKNITTNKNLLKEDLWWYPYTQAKYKGMKAAFKTMFCESMSCKASGVIDALKAFKVIK
jgi:acyl-CoA reductase-like NAD-dependent aldehyde dehydrogenase